MNVDFLKKFTPFGVINILPLFPNIKFNPKINLYPTFWFEINVCGKTCVSPLIFIGILFTHSYYFSIKLSNIYGVSKFIPIFFGYLSYHV